jgi:hypothetical protein
LGAQGKESSWWCFVVVEKEKNSDWLRCAEERKKGW